MYGVTSFHNDLTIKRQERNSQLFKGIFIGMIDGGHFVGAWAGNSSIVIELIFKNVDKKLRFSVSDPYNKLNMRFEYSDWMPIVGFQDSANLNGQ